MMSCGTRVKKEVGVLICVDLCSEIVRCALISEWLCLSPSEVSMYYSGSTSVGRLGYRGWIWRRLGLVGREGERREGGA